MADGIGFDFSELERLAADLESVAREIEKPLKQALNVTSFKVKKGAQEKVGQRRHFRQAARSITFDVFGRRGEVVSEIGYEKGRGGAAHLGNLIEFGSPGSPNALAPGYELRRSLHENEDDFVRGIMLAIDEAQRKAGL